MEVLVALCLRERAGAVRKLANKTLLSSRSVGRQPLYHTCSYVLSIYRVDPYGCIRLLLMTVVVYYFTLTRSITRI